MNTNDDPELKAIAQCAGILERFEEPARQRILNYLCGRFPKATPFTERGRIGGQARAASLSPERRSEIASQAANRRWQGEPSQ